MNERLSIVTQQKIIQTMIDFRCPEEIATQKVLFEMSQWTGDVVEEDELNGKETVVRSDALLERVE